MPAARDPPVPARYTRAGEGMLETRPRSSSWGLASALLCILAVGATLRFYGLGAESLWNDELASWFQSGRGLSLRDVLEHARRDVHPPGYLLLLHLVQSAFGDSEMVLRTPSAIAGVASIALLYQVGARLYCRRIGLVAAALLAVSWAPIYYSQEARSYSLLMMLVLACVLLLGKVFASLDGPRSKLAPIAALYVLTAAAACYVHYFGALFVGLQGLLGLLLCRNGRALAVVGGAHLLVSLLYAPWVASMIEQTAKGRGFWIPEPAFLGSLSAIFFFAFEVPEAFGLFAIAPLFVYFVVSVLSSIRSSRGCGSPLPGVSRSDLVVLAWIAAPFLAAYALSHLLTPVLTYRNLIVVTPAVYLMLARALSSLPWAVARRTWAVVVGAGIVFGLVRGDYYGAPKKEQFREAARYVVEHDESLPVVAHTFGKHKFDYYFGRMGSPARVDLLAGERPGQVAAVRSLVRDRGADAFWFVSGHREPDLEFLARLRRVFRLQRHMEYRGAAASLYRVPPLVIGVAPGRRRPTPAIRPDSDASRW